MEIISAHGDTQAQEENEVNQISGFLGTWVSGFPDSRIPGVPGFY